MKIILKYQRVIEIFQSYLLFYRYYINYFEKSGLSRCYITSKSIVSRTKQKANDRYSDTRAKSPQKPPIPSPSYALQATSSHHSLYEILQTSNTCKNLYKLAILDEYNESK